MLPSVTFRRMLTLPLFGFSSRIPVQDGHGTPGYTEYSPTYNSVLRKHGQPPVIELNGERYGPLLTTRPDDDDDDPSPTAIPSFVQTVSVSRVGPIRN